MKKYLHFKPAILLVLFFSTVVIGCSKSNTLTGIGDQAINAGDDPANRLPQEKGAISGTIITWGVEVKLAISNSDYFSDNYSLNRSGQFQFENLPPGMYSLLVINGKTSVTTEIPGIKVKAGVVTDLGRIMVQ